jgi:sulfatase maturation enzyme AslB (radical SAM superfamily)
MAVMGLKKRFREVVADRPNNADRLPFLLNDMVIEEQLCQMRCAYCLTEEYNLLMNVPDARQRLTTDHRADWTQVLDAYHKHVDAPVLRLSGGEFFWLKGSTEFVADCSSRYETIQVITNGVFLNEQRLAALAAIGNCQLNISLDGHTPELNRHRFPPRQRRLFDVVLKGLARAVEAGLRVEIQSVLTDANIDGQLEFARYLRDRYDNRVTLYFFPARGDVAERFGYEPGPYLNPVLEHYDELAGVLPPRAYVEHIAGQLRTLRRTLPCFITGAMVQLFGQGDVSACPHAWLEPMGNLDADPELIAREYAKHRDYDLFMQERPRFAFCRGCATPSDVVNLYLLGRISFAEITATPLYSGPRTGERLRELKALYQPILPVPSIPAAAPARP